MKHAHWTAAIALTLAAAAAPTLVAPARAAETIVVAQAEKPTGQGTINSIDASGRKMSITHGPVAALRWPGMTMDFGVGPGVDLTALKTGSKIEFTLTRGPDGMYVIDSVQPSR